MKRSIVTDDLPHRTRPQRPRDARSFERAPSPNFSIGFILGALIAAASLLLVFTVYGALVFAGLCVLAIVAARERAGRARTVSYSGVLAGAATVALGSVASWVWYVGRLVLENQRERVFGFRRGCGAS